MLERLSFVEFLSTRIDLQHFLFHPRPQMSKREHTKADRMGRYRGGNRNGAQNGANRAQNTANKLGDVI